MINIGTWTRKKKISNLHRLFSYSYTQVTGGSLLRPEAAELLHMHFPFAKNIITSWAGRSCLEQLCNCLAKEITEAASQYRWIYSTNS